MNLSLEKPLFLLVIPVGIALVWLLVRQRPKVGFSKIELSDGMWSVPFNLLQKLLLTLAVVLLGIALAKPVRYTTTAVPVYVQARDIVLCLDISGSMGSNPVGVSGSGATKLVLAKSVISNFISARPQDRISIVTFDTRAYLDWPLSIDHRALLARLKQIKQNGGTEIGVGMIAALEQLALFGNQEGAVIILSDGISSLKPAQIDTIGQLIAQTQPQLYWVVIGSQSDALTVQFGKYIEGWGGKVYQTTAAELQQVFDEISQLEASPVVYEQSVTSRVEFGSLLLVLAGVLVLVSLLEINKEVS